MTRLVAAVVLALLAVAAPATADPLKDPPYPLDVVPRSAPAGDLACPHVELVAYTGDVLRYKPIVWVYTGFRPRLAAFEAVVRDVAVEVYGRAPERIVSLGAYGCRRMRDHAGWLSEHALGNAIDVEGFDFGHLPRSTTLPPGLDAAFAQGFEVRVLRPGNDAGQGPVVVEGEEQSAGTGAGGDPAGQFIEGVR